MKKFWTNYSFSYNQINKININTLGFELIFYAIKREFIINAQNFITELISYYSNGNIFDENK
jgi:hypothetical protein